MLCGQNRQLVNSDFNNFIACLSDYFNLQFCNQQIQCCSFWYHDCNLFLWQVSLLVTLKISRDNQYFKDTVAYSAHF